MDEKQLKKDLAEVLSKYGLENHEVLVKTKDGGVAWINITQHIK